MSFEFPSLIHILPCEYNRQTDDSYNADYWGWPKELFNVYHECNKTARIIHNNGGW